MKVLLTGATGFVGKSILPLLRTVEAEVYGLGRSVMPRDLSWLSGYIRSDIRDLWTPDIEFDVIIHAATPASASINHEEPSYMFDVIVDGMKNMIRVAKNQSKPPILLFTSSGAVYGELPKELDLYREGCRFGAPSFDHRSAYAEGKRAAEFLLAEAGFSGVCDPRLARLFAFSGTNLPLNRHFAIGNFVRDAVLHQHIQMRSDGSAIRSYLDQHDLANWLFAIILKGTPSASYHIGSERAVSIADLANLVAQRFEYITEKPCSIEILGKSSPLDGVSRYVPETCQTRRSLQVEETVSLETSIDNMITYCLNGNPHANLG